MWPWSSSPTTDGLHPVVEDLARHPAQGLEGSHVAAKHGLQVLVQDEPGPVQARMAEHQREQPDDPGKPGSSVNVTWK